MHILLNVAIHHPVSTAKGTWSGLRKSYKRFRDPDHIPVDYDTMKAELKEKLNTLEKFRS